MTTRTPAACERAAALVESALLPVCFAAPDPDPVTDATLRVPEADAGPVAVALATPPDVMMSLTDVVAAAGGASETERVPAAYWT